MVKNKKETIINRKTYIKKKLINEDQNNNKKFIINLD